tara:strand:- start:190 stop:444 length:255 start_codon:yes stop_codon:yes gene_type:complete
MGVTNNQPAKKKIGKGQYHYTDSNGKTWLLQNRGYYFQWQTNMWSAYGQVPNAMRLQWNAADLEISDTMKGLIQKIERKISKEA